MVKIYDDDVVDRVEVGSNTVDLSAIIKGIDNEEKKNSTFEVIDDHSDITDEIEIDDLDDTDNEEIENEINEEIKKLNKETKNADDDYTDVKTAYKQYLQSIAPFYVLPAEEEVEAFKEYYAGSKEAKEKLINHNLKLVAYTAKSFDGYGLDIMDLIGEGNIGLMKAVERFDVYKGYKFSTYARYWIVQAMQRYVVNNGKMIRVPVHAWEKLTKMKRAIKKLNEKLYREPTLQEIADELNIKVERVGELMQIAEDVVSLDQPVKDGEGDSVLGDFIQSTGTSKELLNDGSELERQERLRIINDVLNQFNERERRIISMRFGLNGYRPMTLEEVGHEYNVSRERIRQVEARIIRKLRNPNIKRRLKDFL